MKSISYSPASERVTRSRMLLAASQSARAPETQRRELARVTLAMWALFAFGLTLAFLFA